MIIRNGYNVYPRQVEEVLAHAPRRHHGRRLRRAARDARAGDRGGRRAARRRDRRRPRSWSPSSSDEIAAYKFPRVVHVVDALPLGPSGKVLKRDLVARFAAQEAAVTPS